jgi:prepilin-type N-terminal cleavage/methylation domain-containing protein
MQRNSYDNVLSNEAHHVQQHARGGWTLVELLTTTAIIGVLLALTIPAVQSARESAHKTQMQNSLRQLSQAQQMFHDTHGHFAPAFGESIAQEGAAHAGEHQENVAWPVNLRPFMEANTPYDTYHTPYFQTQETYDAKLPLLHPNKAGGTSFLAVVGDVAPDITSPSPHFFVNPQAAMNGAMPVEPHNQPTRIASFTDGTSNTLMFIEGSIDTQIPIPNPYPIPADEVRRYWSPFYGAAYISVSGQIATTGADTWSQIIHAGSYRGHSVIAAKADGSVTTISQNADAKVLRAMATRAGGEIEQGN